MAFALTKVRAYGIEAEEALNNKYQQKLILNITGLATDVDLDLGDYSGTFWTAVGGTEPGATALKAIQDIQTLADSFVGLGGTSIEGYSQQGALGGLVNYDSAASAGGSGSESLTVTGLAVGDTILSATQRVAGANGTAITAFGTVSANTLPVTWTANPGAGAIVRVLVRKVETSASTVAPGSYSVTMNSTNTQLPDILFAASNAPTAYVLELSWILKDQQQPVEVTAAA